MPTSKTKIKMSKWDSSGLRLFENAWSCGSGNQQEFWNEEDLKKMTFDELYQATAFAHRSKNNIEHQKAISEIMGESSMQAIWNQADRLLQELKSRIKSTIEDLPQPIPEFLDYEDFKKWLAATKGYSSIAKAFNNAARLSPLTKDPFFTDTKSNKPNKLGKIAKSTKKITVNGEYINNKMIAKLHNYYGERPDSTQNFLREIGKNFGDLIKDGKITPQAIGRADKLRSLYKTSDALTSIVLEQKNGMGLLFRVDPAGTKSGAELMQKIAGGTLSIKPTSAGMFNKLKEYSSKIGFIERIITRAANSDSKLIKAVRKLPIISRPLGIFSAGLEFAEGNYLSALAGLSGEIVKGAASIPATLYSVYDIGWTLLGYEKAALIKDIDDLFSDGKSFIESYSKNKKYKAAKDSDLKSCNDTIKETKPQSRRYWDEARSSWVDEVTADVDSTFSHDGSLEYAGDASKNSMQRVDTFILTPKNSSSQWKPEIQLRGAPGNSEVTIKVHPYLPDNLAGWAFKFYDDAFVNTTIECYEYVGLKHRANRDNVIKEIDNSFNWDSYGRRYINGKHLQNEGVERLIDLSKSVYISVSMGPPGEAKEEGSYPGMGSGPFCTDPLHDTPISYTLKMTEAI